MMALHRTAKSGKAANFTASKSQETKEKAKSLFRQMQTMEANEVVALLPNRTILKYKPIDFNKITSIQWIQGVAKAFQWVKNFLPKFSEKSLVQRKMRVLRGENEYQQQIWKGVCAQAYQVLLAISQKPLHAHSVDALAKVLRLFDLRAFFCTEQVVQIALIKGMRFLNDENLAALSRHIDFVESAVLEKTVEQTPLFFVELRRALQLTLALREAFMKLKSGQRREPANPIEFNAEFELE